MPYNTRRKSLSLPSLGIHVPVTHAARAAAHRASPTHHHHSASTSSDVPATPSHRHVSPSSASSSPTFASPSDDESRRPAKKVKRTRGSDSISSLSSRPSTSGAKAVSAAVAAAAAAAATATSTPPPSPKPMRQASVEMDTPDAETPPPLSANADIDIDAVNDDIVEAVIRQLQATGNRPHLIKELSAILMLQLKSVQQSANPCAIISSRLATFMKRQCWSGSLPCPLTKELESIHPRRTYYFLTMRPHLPLPDASSSHFVVPRTSIVTPPLSSAPSASEATEEERRRELSPSPEVDLSSPEFDDMDDDIMVVKTPAGSFSVRGSRTSHYVSRHQRGASPPLEKDEKEFTETAEGLQRRKLAGQTILLAAASTAAMPSPPSGATFVLSHSIEQDDALRYDSFLFGSEPRHLSVSNVNSISNMVTSPAMRPIFSLGMRKEPASEAWAKLDSMLDWDRSPENIELEELDGMLDDF